MAPLDQDAAAAAAVLIARYGNGACRRASFRANKLLARGDAGLHALWIEVVRAIQAIQQPWRLPTRG
jgi:hypothetical protein